MMNGLRGSADDDDSSSVAALSAVVAMLVDPIVPIAVVERPAASVVAASVVEPVVLVALPGVVPTVGPHPPASAIIHTHRTKSTGASLV